MKDQVIPQKGYVFTVSGTYFESIGRIKQVKNYSNIEVILPSRDLALSKIRRVLIDPILKNKFPNCTRHRTCYIVNEKQLGETKAKKGKIDKLDEHEIDTMNKEQLTYFIMQENLAVSIENVSSILEARQKVSDALDDKKFSDAQKLKVKEAKKKERKERDELRQMNKLDPAPQEFSDTI